MSSGVPPRKAAVAGEARRPFSARTRPSRSFFGKNVSSGRAPTAANGGCGPEAPVRVYRVYNNGFVRGKDSNHRLLTDFELYAQMLAKGWVGEGVVMCGPA